MAELDRQFPLPKGCADIPLAAGIPANVFKIEGKIT